MTTSPTGDARLDLIVERFVASAAHAQGRERARLIADIERMGAREMNATAAVSRRLADRPFRIPAGRVPLERALADVRAGVLASEINGRGARLLRRAQRKGADAIAALNDAADVLARDTAVIAADQAALSSQVAQLRDYAFLAGRLDTALVAAGAADEFVEAARRRHLEIETHLAVVLQGVTALALLELTNNELMVALRTASASAMAALRSAAMVTDAKGALDVVDRSELRRIAALQRAVDELRAASAATGADSGGALDISSAPDREV